MEQTSAENLFVEYRHANAKDAEDRLNAALDLIVSCILAHCQAHPEDHEPAPGPGTVP